MVHYTLRCVIVRMISLHGAALASTVCWTERVVMSFQSVFDAEEEA